MSEILNKYNIFSDFPLNLKENIKTFYIYVDYLNTKLGYCVLNDNNVYGLGEGIHKRVGYNSSEEKYVLITELCDKNIEEFYEGVNCMFARNNNNEIFSWGMNNEGQLARGFLREWNEFLKPKKIMFFDSKNIIEINCGSNHCLALSSDGLVYGWGGNTFGQVGCGARDTTSILTPVEIELKEKIKFIHCASDKSFAVSFDGTPYYWGGFGYEKIISTPHRISDMKNVSKLYRYSGYSDKMLIILDNNGKVFLFDWINEIIIKIQCDLKFIDLYYDNKNRPLLLFDDCVYRLLENNKIIETEFSNFFEFYSQNLFKCKKTIELTKGGNLSKNKFQFCEHFFDRKYKNNFKEIDSGFHNTIDSTKEENVVINEIQLSVNIIEGKFDNSFQVIKEMGSGSYAEVLQVKQRSDQLLYAIKRISIKDDLILREVKIMCELKSHFVVKYIDSWIEKEIKYNEMKRYLFIQMELCSNNLREFMKLIKFPEVFKTFNYFISYELFRELIECVNYLHSLNPPIIHRDLKPENVLISDGINGRYLKLCDFGISKIHDRSSHTRMAGTFKYIAPEVLKSRKYNTKCDIYSLAIIGTEIFGFDFKDIIDHKKGEDFDKILSEYLGSDLKPKFRKLLKTLSDCLLPEDYHSRPDCKLLLKKIKEFSLEKSIVLSDKSITNFKSFLENQNSIIKKFFETKILIQTTDRPKEKVHILSKVFGKIRK